MIYEEETISQELYIGFDSGRSYGPFQPTFGISGTADGDMWMGAGAKWTSKNIGLGPFFVEASLMPGIYAQGDGPDLGGALQFRSAVGLVIILTMVLRLFCCFPIGQMLIRKTQVWDLKRSACVTHTP